MSNNNNTGECLKLTFDELCHIRNVLTKAELDYLLFDNHLFNEVSRGKVCFSCRKTKFSLFSWGQKCRICQQKICKKCIRTVQLKNGYLMAHVPLFKLQPAAAAGTHQNPLTSPDKYKSMRVVDSNTGDQQQPHNRSDNSEEFEILSMSQASAEIKASSMTFEICCDCFQMMEGVVVSVNESDLASTSSLSNHNSPTLFRHAKKTNSPTRIETGKFKIN